MFFGSAITNFGVEPFLEAFLEITPGPLARESDQGMVDPDSDFFSGFVFKIQANMNPAHRDRLAFIRVVSGEFQKDMNVWLSGEDKLIQLKQPQQFMANEREAVETAYAGDIIGLFDPGIFHLGDTLSSGPKLQFSSIPIFAPEYFARVRPEDSMKRKQFLKGLTQLAEEGAIQLFTRTETGFEELLVGVVGMLQFDVLEHRLQIGVQRDHAQGYAFPSASSAGSRRSRPFPWTSSSSPPPAAAPSTATSAPCSCLRTNGPSAWRTENNKGLELTDTASRVKY